jgi:hypothetical protein
MRRVIRKRVRHQQDGVSLAADIDAVISINTGTGATTTTHAHSSHSVQQGATGERDQPEPGPTDQNGPPEEER